MFLFFRMQGFIASTTPDSYPYYVSFGYLQTEIFFQRLLWSRSIGPLERIGESWYQIGKSNEKI
jgi:hypothetical protein